MKNNKKIVFYTIYKEDVKGDLIPVDMFDNLEDISKKLNITKKTLYNRLNDKKKILNNYIIYKDYISQKDLI